MVKYADVLIACQTTNLIFSNSFILSIIPLIYAQDFG